MIAQWENECISPSVLSMVRVVIAQWENECILLSVLSIARVQFPVVAEYYKRFFLVDYLWVQAENLMTHPGRMETQKSLERFGLVKVVYAQG